MFKTKWEFLDRWMIEDKHRMILRSQQGGPSLVDITIGCENIYEVMHKVGNTQWTKQELMDYLNQR